MPVTDHPYTHSESQFHELRDLLVRSYALTQRLDNWHIAKLECWRYLRYDKPRLWFQRNVRLWRDEAGSLVAYVISHSGEDEVHLQILPSYAWAAPLMLGWAEGAWALGRESLSVDLLQDQTWLSDLLASRGYVDEGGQGSYRRYDLSRPYAPTPLPDGYTIETLALNQGFAAHVRALRAVFRGDERMSDRWYAAMASAPSYAADLDFCVVTGDGQQVAFCDAWVDRANHIAELGMVGTHPDHRRLGLGRAVVSACFRALRARGVRFAIVGAGPEPYHSNRFYEALGPIGQRHVRRWTLSLVG